MMFDLCIAENSDLLVDDLVKEIHIFYFGSKKGGLSKGSEKKERSGIRRFLFLKGDCLPLKFNLLFASPHPSDVDFLHNNRKYKKIY